MDGLKKRQPQKKKMGGVSEEDEKLYGDNQKIDYVLKDNIAKTCLHILTSLVNQDMKVTSSNKKIENLITLFNRKAKITRKIDSVVFNQVSYGYSTIQFSIVLNKIKAFDTTSYKLVYDTIADEFHGIYQDTTYLDPTQLKQGYEVRIPFRGYLDAKNDNLVLIPGIGRALGESLLLPAYPYVKAKAELVDSLYDLVRRLGLLTVINIDFPGDIGDSETEQFLDSVQNMVEEASQNAVWLFPTDTTVQGVKGSGESKVIESVKVMIELLDEEIRKCLFVPDTFLTSLSANRATAKEQRYLIFSMVAHIRKLIEESLIDMYDTLLSTKGLLPKNKVPDYKFSWGNINLPEPEVLVDFLIKLAQMNGIRIEDELRSYLNLGTPKKPINNNAQPNIYQQMGYNRQINEKKETMDEGGQNADRR